MGKVNFSQIGKNGVTDNYIETLKKHFKKNKTTRISVLKSARENGKTDVKEYAEQIQNRLGKNFRVKTIGFVIIVRKFGKTKDL